MGIKAKKSTKKFNQNRLKAELENRKVSKRKRLREKSKEDRAVKRIRDKTDEDPMTEAMPKAVPIDEDINDSSSQAEDELFDSLENVSDQEEPMEEESEKEEDALDEEALDKEIAEHKEELAKLREQDPEFFDYLKSNSKELLDFGEDMVSDEEASEDEEVANEEGDPQDEEDDEEEDLQEDPERVISLEDIQMWEGKVLKDNSLMALKKLLKAFKAAVQSSQAHDEEAQHPVEDMIIQDEQVYTRLLSVMPVLAPATFHKLFALSPEKLASGKQQLPCELKVWKKYQALVKSYLGTLTALLDQITENAMAEFIFRELEKAHVAIYFACFPKSKAIKLFTKLVLKWWSAVPNTEEHGVKAEDKDELKAKKEQAKQKATAVEASRILAFLNLRRLAVYSSSDYLALILKQTYATFVASTMQVTAFTMPVLHFMMNCMVELHALDTMVSYQHAFKSIRQIAIQLRNAITQKTAEVTRSVLSWQVICCIKLWCRLLGHFCDSTGGKTVQSSELTKLIFPLTQVSLGVALLVPTMAYVPLRFHILRSLNELGRRTATYIPLSPYLLDVARLIEEESQKQHKPVNGKTRPIDLAWTLRVSSQQVHSRVYMDTLVEALFDVWLEHFSFQSTMIAFPELAVPVILHLKRIAKHSKYVKLNKQIGVFLQKVQQSRHYILEKRSRVDFAPIHLDASKAFATQIEVTSTPLGAYWMSHKKIRAQQQRLLQH